MTGKFHTDLIESLSKESHGSPLQIQVSPLSTQNNLVCNEMSCIVLSWTSTEISMYQVTISGDNFNAQPLEKMEVLASDIKTVDDLVSKLLHNLLEVVKIAGTSCVILKHDFAKSDDNRLTISRINAPKHWKLEGDRDIDISSLLKNSLSKKVNCSYWYLYPCLCKRIYMYICVNVHVCCVHALSCVTCLSLYVYLSFVYICPYCCIHVCVCVFKNGVHACV